MVAILLLTTKEIVQTDNGNAKEELVTWALEEKQLATEISHNKDLKIKSQPPLGGYAKIYKDPSCEANSKKISNT